MAFFSLTSPKFGEKIKQIQYKILILRTSGCRSSKTIFGVFWHIWLSPVLWAIEKQIFYPPNKIPDIWEQPVQISSKSYSTAAFGGLKCLRPSSFCHILCYPIFYKEIKKSNEKIKHWYPKKCKRKRAQRLE